MLEAIILGIVQGAAEWLPISSEGLIFLIKSKFFYNNESLLEITRLALWLHLGTFFSALVYFRQEVANLLKTLFNYKQAGQAEKKLLLFIAGATLISGGVGILILQSMKYFQEQIPGIVGFVVLFVGFLLIITGGLQIRAKHGGEREEKDLKTKDALIVGLAQGLAALPGLSRSGLTVSVLLLGKFKNQTAIRLSFILSLPIVLGGNIILNFDKLSFNPNYWLAVIFSFVVGWLTIHVFLALARKVNFGYFVLGFGVLMIMAFLI